MGRCRASEHVPVKSRAGQWSPEARKLWRRLWRCHTDRYCRRNWNEIADLEEHGVVVTGRKRGWSPIGQASPDGAVRPAWTALAVARLDRRWITGLAGRDRERLRAGGTGHGRLVLGAGERDLEEHPAAGHADGTPGVVLEDDAPRR